MSIIIAILVFSFLVLTHELGHFLMAKRAKIGVTEFSIGMGPRLLSKEWRGTRYSLKAVPFGGSCLMVGEDEDSPEEDSFNSKSICARILVIAGGPLSNFLFAFLLALIAIGISGYNKPEVYGVSKGYGAEQAGIQAGDVITSINGKNITIGRDIELYLLDHPLDGSMVTLTYEREGQEHTAEVDPHYASYWLGISYADQQGQATLTAVVENSPAQAYGLEAGDQIVSIDGKAITNTDSLKDYLSANPMGADPIALTVERNGSVQEITVTPEYVEGLSLGLSASYYRESGSIPQVIRYSVSEVRYWISYTLSSLKMLVTGQVSVKEMSGPVGITSVISTAVEASREDGTLYVILNIMNLAILLSANLGVFNLLPIPALDGGRLVFLIIEAIRGKKISQEKEGMVHAIGFALLMLLMVFVLFNDIMRLFTG